MFNFKALALTTALTATTFAAPGAQAFSLGDALGIANTVINTVQTIENGVNGNTPAPQATPQYQQPQQPTMTEQAAMDQSMDIVCNDADFHQEAAALEMMGYGNCTSEQTAAHDIQREIDHDRTIACQAALGPNAYWATWGRCEVRSVGTSSSNLRGPGTISHGSSSMR